MFTGRALATVAGIVWTMVGVAAFVAIVGSVDFHRGYNQLFSDVGLLDTVDLGAVYAVFPGLVGLCIVVGVPAWIVAAAVGTIRAARRR
jgi:ABC-type transport system involved in cytochrome c biogenesis permease subunit